LKGVSYNILFFHFKGMVITVAPVEPLPKSAPIIPDVDSIFPSNPSDPLSVLIAPPPEQNPPTTLAPTSTMKPTGNAVTKSTTNLSSAFSKSNQNVNNINNNNVSLTMDGPAGEILNRLKNINLDQEIKSKIPPPVIYTAVGSAMQSYLQSFQAQFDKQLEHQSKELMNRIEKVASDRVAIKMRELDETNNTLAIPNSIATKPPTAIKKK
jgi:hypothetical protein